MPTSPESVLPPAGAASTPTAAAAIIASAAGGSAPAAAATVLATAAGGSAPSSPTTVNAAPGSGAAPSAPATVNTAPGAGGEPFAPDWATAPSGNDSVPEVLSLSGIEAVPVNGAWMNGLFQRIADLEGQPAWERLDLTGSPLKRALLRVPDRYGYVIDHFTKANPEDDWTFYNTPFVTAGNGMPWLVEFMEDGGLYGSPLFTVSEWHSLPVAVLASAAAGNAPASPSPVLV